LTNLKKKKTNRHRLEKSIKRGIFNFLFFLVDMTDIIENGSKHGSIMNVDVVDVEQEKNNGIIQKTEQNNLEAKNDSKMDLDDEDEKSILSLVKPKTSISTTTTTKPSNHQHETKRTL